MAATTVAVGTIAVGAAAATTVTSAPTITSVSPHSLAQGASSQPLTTFGTGFVIGSKVTSHIGIVAKTTYVSATQLNLSVSVAAAETPGSYDVFVTNPDGGKFRCTGCLTVTTPPPTGLDWPGYLYSSVHSSYNPGATAISPANAGQLAPAWKWLPPPSPNSATTSLLASPTVVNGVVYQGVKDGEFYAVRESDQSIVWSRFLAVNAPLPTGSPSCGVGDYQGIISTATVTIDPSTGKLTVYVYAPDGYMYALDAETGGLVWKALVFTPSTTLNDYYSWGSPLVANGRVYIGISSDCDNPLVPGGLSSFDQSTGSQVAHWASTPPGQVGGSVWSSPLALSDGSIIVTTGNAHNTGTQALYNESMVRLDGSTLNLLDAWQVPHEQQVFDADFGASPTIFTATINGVSTPMVGACNKNGLYYAFRQSDLHDGPVWQTRITVPYPGGAAECDSAAIWDGTNLIEAGGAPTTIDGTTYIGSIRSLDPATGNPLWQTGLQGSIVGSPTEDGAGLVAAQTYQTSNGQIGVYLVNASTGAIAGFLPTPQSPLFGQAIFVGNDLIIGAGSHLGLTAYQVSLPGPSIARVDTETLTPGRTIVIKITGSGFSGEPIATVSSDGVTAGRVKVVSSTELQVKLTVLAAASIGTRDISVSFPGSPPTVDSCSSCLTIAMTGGSPTLALVAPNSVHQGGKHQVVTLTGADFQSGAKVTSRAGITISTAFVSATQLTSSVSVAASVPPGNYNLVVRNPDGGYFNCKSCLSVVP